jgi:tetratricopeptide (TPR) repeat protein
MTKPSRPRQRNRLTLERLAKAMTAAISSEEVDALMQCLLELSPPTKRRYLKLRQLSREFLHWDYALVLAETRQAPALWRRLEALPYPEQLRAVAAEDNLHTWGLCRLLQRMSGGLTGERPESAAQLANLAVEISRHLDPAYDRDWIHDLRALSFAYLGNARRALGELHGAADAFDSARLHRLAGTAYPSVEAEILALEGLLRRDQRRLGEAAAIFERVHALCASTDWQVADPDVADPQRAGEALLHQAWCVYHRGQIAPAMALLEQAQPLLDPRSQARQSLALASGRVWGAIRLGSFEEAKARLAAATQLASRRGDDRDCLRLRRAAARLDAALGEQAAAAAALRQLADDLLDAEYGIDAALAWVDLVVLACSREGSDEASPEAAEELGCEMLSVFSSREIGRGAFIHLMLLQQACATRRITRGLAEGLGAGLERIRRPSLWWSSYATVLEVPASDAPVPADPTTSPR